MKKTHKAAVKALDWSETKFNIIATGGGSADWSLRLFDVNTRKLICL